MRQLRWTFSHLRLWAFELKLWLDGLSWEQARIVAERSIDLAGAVHERNQSMQEAREASKEDWKLIQDRSL